MEKQQEPKIQLPVPNPHGDDNFQVPEIVHELPKKQVWEDEDEWVGESYDEDEYE